MPKKLFTIAFDLGGVVFASSNDTNIFSANYLDTALNPGISAVIRELSRDKNNKLIVVSKAYQITRERAESSSTHGLDEYFAHSFVKEGAEVSNLSGTRCRCYDRRSKRCAITFRQIYQDNSIKPKLPLTY